MGGKSRSQGSSCSRACKWEEATKAGQGGEERSTRHQRASTSPQEGKKYPEEGMEEWLGVRRVGSIRRAHTRNDWTGSWER